MAEVIDFEDLKKDSGDLKNLEDSELQKLSNNIQKQLDLDKTIEELEETIKEFKRERAILSEEIIPQQMQELGSQKKGGSEKEPEIDETSIEAPESPGVPKGGEI